MIKKQISQNIIDKEVKKNLLIDSSLAYITTESDFLKEQRVKSIEKIIIFYQNEYIPVLMKHNDLMKEWNKINMELFSRGDISKQDVMDSNELLKNKLEKLLIG